MLEYLALLAAFLIGWVAGIATLIVLLECTGPKASSTYEDDNDDDDQSPH